MAAIIVDGAANAAGAPVGLDPVGIPGPCVYLLCFAHNPYRHAKHYIGVSLQPLANRLAAHRGDTRYGRSAVLLKHLRKEGGTFALADVWDAESDAQAFELERQLKRHNNTGHLCSICSPGNKRGTGERGRPRQVRAEGTT